MYSKWEHPFFSFSPNTINHLLSRFAPAPSQVFKRTWNTALLSAAPSVVKGSVWPAAGLNALRLLCPVTVDPSVHSFGQTSVQDVLDVLHNQIYGNYKAKNTDSNS